MNEAEFLIRELDGTLSPEGAVELEKSIKAQPDLAAKRSRWRRVAEELSTARATSFGQMFSDRVIARIREAQRSGEDTMYVHLRWMFTRVAAAGVGLALVLGAYNATGGPELSSSVVETLFGWPAPSLESAVMLADA